MGDQYAGNRVARGCGRIAVGLAFRGQRRRHKVMQYLHNDVSEWYFEGMEEFTVGWIGRLGQDNRRKTPEREGNYSSSLRL